MAILINIDHVSFSYRGVGGEAISALHDISLQIEDGEFLAIIGANGSGKTTLARLMASLLMPSGGQITVAGMNTNDKSAWNELHQVIGMVFQNPEDQVITTIVEEDVAFGLENMGLPPHEIRKRAREALEEVDLWDERKRPPNMLSAGQMQRLALAGVIAMQPRCVIFDEATTMLDPIGRKVALDAMRRMNAQGITVIFITHFMDEAAQARRVLLLQNGQIQQDGTPLEVFHTPQAMAKVNLELPLAMALAYDLHQEIPAFPEDILTVNELVTSILKIWNNKNSQAIMTRTNNPDPTRQFAEDHYLVEVKDLRHIYLRGTPLEKLALEGVSMQVRNGDSHGLAGVTGSGKSTLMQHLNGLLRPQAGTVRVGSFLLNDPKVNMKMVIQVAGLVFQNPEMQFFEQYVGDEIAYGPKQMGVKEGLSERVRWAMEMVGMDFVAFKDRLIFSLSGGERRKVALASTLALKPSLLLLDEPTAGLDPSNKKDLIVKLHDMQVDGMTIVLSSHQMEVIAALANNLTIFHEGRDVLTGATDQIFTQAETLAQYGLEPPAIFQVMNDLRRNGVPLMDNITEVEALSSAIKGLLK